MARTIALVILYAVPPLLALAVRLELPSYFEYESQEDTVRALAILEKGDLPLYGIGHIRFLGGALGPLVYYFKAIPYLFTSNPMGENAWLITWHLAAIVIAMLLARDLFVDLFFPSAANSAQRQQSAPREPGPVSYTMERTPVSVGTCPGVAHFGAILVGLLLALSVHSNTLTSHPHPSYFASAFMLPFLWGLYRFVVRGESRGWLTLSGAALGVMTQFYQLTLFAPVLALVVLLACRRLPSRRDAWRFLAPVLVCYIPYLASELFTGFWNTRNILSFSPGPGDDAAVGADSTARNLAFVLNAAVAHFHVPDWLDGVWLVLAAAGVLGWAVAGMPRRGSHSRRAEVLADNGGPRSRAAPFALAFFVFYAVLPAVALDSPRFQLMLPAHQLAIVTGLVGMLLLGRRVWSSASFTVRTPAPSLGPAHALPMRIPVRLAIAGSILAIPASAAVFLANSTAGLELRSHVFYPLNMLHAEPAGHTPTLSQTAELMRVLHDEHGLSLEDVATRLVSPALASGDYGHHLLLRAAQGRTPSVRAAQGRTSSVRAAQGRTPSAPSLDCARGRPLRKQSGSCHASDRTNALPAKLLVYDDLFPYVPLSTRTTSAGPFSIAELDRRIDPESFTVFSIAEIAQRIDPESFTVEVTCDNDWCSRMSSRLAGSHAGPNVGFFWGCGEFKELDPRLFLPPEECEDLLEAPVHSRVYSGKLRIPEGTATIDHRPSTIPTEVVYVAAWQDCAVAAEIDGAPLGFQWTAARKLKFGFAEIPAQVATPGEHDLVLHVNDCVPFHLQTLEFTAVARRGISP